MNAARPVVGVLVNISQNGVKHPSRPLKKKNRNEYDIKVSVKRCVTSVVDKMIGNGPRQSGHGVRRKGTVSVIIEVNVEWWIRLREKQTDRYD